MLLAFIRVPSIQPRLLFASTTLAASSLLCMSSMMITSGRSYFRFNPRKLLPAPRPARIMLLPRKLNFFSPCVSFSRDNLQSPKTLRMLLLLNVSAMSAIKFSARVAVLQTTRINFRFVKNTNQTTYNFNTIVLPKPRGSPIAIFFCPLSSTAACVINCQTARNTGGNRNLNTSGRHRAPKKFISPRAASIAWSLVTPTSGVCSSAMVRIDSTSSLFSHLLAARHYLPTPWPAFLSVPYKQPHCSLFPYFCLQSQQPAYQSSS